MMSLLKKVALGSQVSVVGLLLAVLGTGCAAGDDSMLDDGALAAVEGREIALEDVDTETLDSMELAAAASWRPHGDADPRRQYADRSWQPVWLRRQRVSYLTMQRSRWYGWEDMKTVKIVGPGENYVKYNCSRTGTHEFRVIHTATTVGGTHLFKESTHHTFNCGN